MKVGLIGDSLTEGRPGVSFYNVLKLQYPHISFDNLGNPGETIKSLFTRLEKHHSNLPMISLLFG